MLVVLLLETYCYAQTLTLVRWGKGLLVQGLCWKKVRVHWAIRVA